MFVWWYVCILFCPTFRRKSMLEFPFKVLQRFGWVTLQSAEKEMSHNLRADFWMFEMGQTLSSEEPLVDFRSPIFGGFFVNPGWMRLVSCFRIVWKESLLQRFLEWVVFIFRISFEQLLQPHGCCLCLLIGVQNFFPLLYLMCFTFLNPLQSWSWGKHRCFFSPGLQGCRCFRC